MGARGVRLSQETRVRGAGGSATTRPFFLPKPCAPGARVASPAGGPSLPSKSPRSLRVRAQNVTQNAKTTKPGGPRKSLFLSVPRFFETAKVVSRVGLEPTT